MVCSMTPSSSWPAPRHTCSSRPSDLCVTDEHSPLIQIADARDDVRTLGPAIAAAIWVQGCLRACRGCMSPHTFDPTGGATATVASIATWLQATGRLFLTVSGGEPMDQAAALVALIDRVRADRDWVVTCYTGHRIEELLAGGDASVLALLDRLDLLIDGAYVEASHAPLRWRASSNQRIHSLSGRVEVGPDEPVGIDVHFDDHDAFRFIGVPPEPRFAETFVEIWPATDTPPVSITKTIPPALPFPTEECP